MKIFEHYPDSLSASKKIVLGVQHTFTMFGATVLVPILTGMDIAVALCMAGLATLLFHTVTRGKAPVFLGSSFAFIAPVAAVAAKHGLAYAQGGIVVAGVVYLILAALIYFFGVEKVVRFFPPIVTGPVIMVIGLQLAGTAVANAQQNWLLALVSFAIVAGVSVFTKGFIRVLPVLCGLVGGYTVAALTGNVDFQPFFNAGGPGLLGGLFALPKFTMAKWNLDAIVTIAPVAVATMVEHMGDIFAISATCGQDFVKSPGLHRTLLGDGLATSLSALLGGPANTTYSENTGVLALTKVYNPVVMRIAACFAILLSLLPKVSALIATIPNPVIGGISIVLFGMIAAVGVRTVVENRVDFTKSRNLIIAAVILVLGLGGGVLEFPLAGTTVTFGNTALAALAGILLNKLLPDKA
jgi:uracil permease